MLRPFLPPNSIFAPPASPVAELPLIVTSSDVSSVPLKVVTVAVIYTGLYFSIARRKVIAIYFTSSHSLSKLDAAVSNKSSCILCG